MIRQAIHRLAQQLDFDVQLLQFIHILLNAFELLLETVNPKVLDVRRIHNNRKDTAMYTDTETIRMNIEDPSDDRTEVVALRRSVTTIAPGEIPGNPRDVARQIGRQLADLTDVLEAAAADSEMVMMTSSIADERPLEEQLAESKNWQAFVAFRTKLQEVQAAADNLRIATSKARNAV